MISFEEHMLRDQSYRDRFYGKLEEIRAVRKEHTFLAYATNKDLIEELTRLYQENLENYESCYLDNFKAFEQQLDDLDSQIEASIQNAKKSLDWSKAIPEIQQVAATYEASNKRTKIALPAPRPVSKAKGADSKSGKLARQSCRFHPQIDP